MPKVVEVPGVGNVEFPDSMSDTAISQAIQKQVGAPKVQAQPQDQDAFEKAVNFHTGNSLIDAPLSLIQGGAKELAGTGVGVGQIYRKLTGQAPLPADTFKSDTEATDGWQRTGKFLTGVAEYAIPAGAVGAATKGAGLLARAGAQAAVGGAISAAQSGADPTSTAIGAGLGGGEVLSAAGSVVKKLAANRAPNLRNFAESFQATPKQKGVISNALDMLERDGVVPPGDVQATQDVIKGKLADLNQAYENLPADIKARQQPVSDVVSRLEKVQGQFVRKGVVTDEAGYNTLQKEIDKAKGIADQNGNGSLDLDDIVHLKQKANGRTTFQSPDADKSLWKAIGDSYRGAADKLAPETTGLNQDYARYKNLEKIIDKNVAEGKGTTPSGLDRLMSDQRIHQTGADAGALLGYMVAGPGGAVAGRMMGPIIATKLAVPVRQALQNTIDNGSFAALPKGKQAMVALAAKVGDNKSVLRLLGISGFQEGTQTARQGAQ